MSIASKYSGSHIKPIKFKNVLEKLFDISLLKAFVLSIAGLVGGFLAPIWAFVLGSFTLVFIDYFTGKKASVKRGEKITSMAMRRSIDKALIYMMFIIAAHVIDVLFRIPYDPLSYIAALAVARVEFFSIDENVNQLTGVSIKDNIKQAFEISTRRNGK